MILLVLIHDSRTRDARTTYTLLLLLPIIIENVLVCDVCAWHTMSGVWLSAFWSHSILVYGPIVSINKSMTLNWVLCRIHCICLLFIISPPYDVPAVIRIIFITYSAHIGYYWCLTQWCHRMKTSFEGRPFVCLLFLLYERVWVQDASSQRIVWIYLADKSSFNVADEWMLSSGIFDKGIAVLSCRESYHSISIINWPLIIN